MSKSKAVITEPKMVSEEYNRAVSSLIDICNVLFQNTSNQLSEIYRISNIVGFFASQKAYFDRLREQFSKAKDDQDFSGLRSLMYKIENNQECKAYDFYWSEISKMYDAMIESIRQESNNDDITMTLKTADEILESKQKYYTQSDKERLAEQIKTMELMLNL